MSYNEPALIVGSFLAVLGLAISLFALVAKNRNRRQPKAG